jgi:mxaJ protein
MYSRYKRGFHLSAHGSFAVLCLSAVMAGEPTLADGQQAAPPHRILRIAADPNNLPFSNERREGFENKIAELIARELNAGLEYVWRAQRRGFFRETLKGGNCDLVMGVPAQFEPALTTLPYYRSTYVFISRADKHLGLHSLDDPELRRLKIGAQLVGNDGVNTPPVHALAARQIITNVVGYTVYGDYRQENPAARIVSAAAAGDIDVALVWGPLGGYFAGRSPVPLEVVPIPPDAESPSLPFVFDISIGVRKSEEALRDELNGIIDRNRAAIKKILKEYGVPLLDRAGSATALGSITNSKNAAAAPAEN